MRGHNKPRGFRRTQLRLTGIYLARRWIGRVSQLSGPAEFIAWWNDRELSGPARREFVDLAVGAIRKVSPLGRRSEFMQVLTSVSETLIKFQKLNELCWSQDDPLTARLY